MKIVKLLVATLFFMVFMTGKGFAQCSLLECQEMLGQKTLLSGPFKARFGDSAFAPPEKTWQWQPKFQVAQVNQEYNPCWLTDLPSCRQFPALQFAESRTEISSRVLIYRARGENTVTEVSLGFHRRPKGFGLVWRRSF